VPPGLRLPTARSIEAPRRGIAPGVAAASPSALRGILFRPEPRMARIEARREPGPGRGREVARDGDVELASGEVQQEDAVGARVLDDGDLGGMVAAVRSDVLGTDAEPRVRRVADAARVDLGDVQELRTVARAPVVAAPLDGEQVDRRLAEL